MMRIPIKINKTTKKMVQIRTRESMKHSGSSHLSKNKHKWRDILSFKLISSQKTSLSLDYPVSKYFFNILKEKK